MPRIAGRIEERRRRRSPRTGNGGHGGQSCNRRATWIGAAIAVALTEAIGLAAEAFPRAWLTLFDGDPAMVAAGSLYLHAVGPLYGFFGLGLILYFASQGAGRLLWPVLGNVARLAVAGLGGWGVLRWGGGLAHLFLAQGAALVIYGLINAGAVAGGAWFGPVRLLPRATIASRVRRSSSCRASDRCRPIS